MNYHPILSRLSQAKGPLKATILMISILLACVVEHAQGHGSISDPVSRAYRIFQENPESPKSSVSAAAIATAGTQAFYDWHEISRMVPQYDPASIKPYRAIIPDGQLAGAGLEKYAGLNLIREDWLATAVNPGLYPVVFDAWAPHDPGYFLAFITRGGWSPDMPLAWNDLEPLPGAEQVVRDGHYYRFTVDFPQRKGHHVLYVVWQRIDPAGEVFFSASDIDFGDGTGNGNGGGNPGNEPVIPLDIRVEVDFSVQSDWDSGFTAEVEITNLSDHPINSWKLEFEIDQEISSFWNAELLSREGNHYTVSHSGWNQSIPAGGSVTFGFSAAPGKLESINPSHLTLNGTSLHTHEHEQHPFLLNVGLTRLPSGAVERLTLSFPATSGNSYNIEESTDLINWQSRETGIPGKDGTIMRDYPTGQATTHFFRARREHD